MAISSFRVREGLILLWLIGLLIFRRNMNFSNKKLLFALTIWLSYFIINTLIIKSFHPFFMGTYIAKIMIAYWLIQHYKADIFKKYEDIIYFLAIISLLFWFCQLVLPNGLNQLITTLDLSGELVRSKSIILYTWHYLSIPGEIPRNAGFTWEPGPFSSYIALAIFINLARHGVSFKDRKRLMIFVLAMITTQSTTGFLLLLTILLWYSWTQNSNKFFRIISVPFAVSLIVFMYINVPWLQEKIISEFQQNIEDVIAHAKITGGSYAPGRFASFQLRWEDFKNYPVAGYGGNSLLQYGYLGEGNVVSAISGLGTILGKYGAIGAVIFLFLLFRSGKLLARHFRYSGFAIFPALLLIIGFSFGIIESPILVIFLLTPVFIKGKIKILKKIKILIKYNENSFLNRGIR